MQQLCDTTIIMLVNRNIFYIGDFIYALVLSIIMIIVIAGFYFALRIINYCFKVVD